MRILLFHGTRIPNMLGILSQGLLIAPIEASRSGYKYGKGIYLTDIFSKALNYAETDVVGKCYVLICEAVLGNTLQLSEKKQFVSDKDIIKKGYDSMINDADYHCSFDEIFYLKDGSGVFRKVIEPKNKNRQYDNNNNKKYVKDDFSEYVFYKENLVRVKYIVEMNS